MWDLPGPGVEPWSLSLTGRLFTTEESEQPGKPVSLHYNEIKVQHFKSQRLIEGLHVPLVLHQIQHPNNIPNLPALQSAISLKVRGL